MDSVECPASAYFHIDSDAECPEDTVSDGETTALGAYSFENLPGSLDLELIELEKTLWELYELASGLELKLYELATQKANVSSSGAEAADIDVNVINVDSVIVTGVDEAALEDSEETQEFQREQAEGSTGLVIESTEATLENETEEILSEIANPVNSSYVFYEELH